MRQYAILTGTVLWLLFPACVEPDPVPEGPVEHRQVADVPVPSGFQFVSDRNVSYYFESGSFRNGKLVYHHEVDSKGAWREFFERRLPEHGWIAGAATDDRLSFTMGPYSLEVELSPIGPGENRGFPYKTVVAIRTTGRS